MTLNCLNLVAVLEELAGGSFVVRKRRQQLAISRLVTHKITLNDGDLRQVSSTFCRDKAASFRSGAMFSCSCVFIYILSTLLNEIFASFHL